MSKDLTIQETQAYIDAIVREDFDAPKLLPIRIAEQLVATMQREAKLREALKEGAQCLWDVGAGKGGWAWEEVHDNMVALSSEYPEVEIKE